MDSDDICERNRFADQIKYFNSFYDLVGGQIVEFNENIFDSKNIKRRVPINEEEIKKFSKLRNPFNHPTVMFRKEFFNDVGKYKEMKFFEDYFLG